MKSLIQYKGRLTTNQLDAISTQLELHERDTPLVFKGRTRILARIKRLVRELKQPTFNTNRSLAHVIQGAPGAGKTSLLSELERQCTDEKLDIRTIRISGKDLKSTNSFIGAMLTGFDEAINELTTKTTVKRGGGINLEAAKGELSSEREYGSKLESVNFRTVWEVLEQVLGRDKVILLCIDEAQTIRDDERTGTNPILLDFHVGGTGRLRIIPVFAGLNDTSQILSGLGMSRLTDDLVFHLSSLSKQESEDVVLGTLNHVPFGLADRITVEDKTLIATSLRIASDRWPRHLHYYVQGVLREVLEDQERDLPANRIDLNRVLEHGHDARVTYYDRRAQLLRDDFIEDLMNAVTNNPSNLEKRELGGTEEDFDDAIHYGLLETEGLGAKKSINVPIPSLRTFLICRGDFEQTKRSFRQQHEEQLKLELGQVQR